MQTLDPLEALGQQDLMDFFDELQHALKYRNLTDAGLQIGTGSKKEVRQNAASVDYLIDGVFYNQGSAQEVGFTATDHDIAADASEVQEACYVVGIDSSGNLSLTMGTIASGAGNAKLPEWDDLPTDEAFLGYVRIAVDAGATDFDATGDDLDAGHLSVTYVDLGWLLPNFSSEQ